MRRLENLDIAILLPFAAFNTQHHALPVDVGDLQARDFGDAQAGCVGRGQNRAVLETAERDLPRIQGGQEAGVGGPYSVLYGQ
jgi:hypothetical protein